jgi:nicotinamidase-related amidase
VAVPAHFLSRAATVLVVVDVQERLLTAIPEEPRTRLLHHLSILIQSAHTLALPVLLTEQYPQGLGPTADAVASAVGPGVAPIEKTCFSCARSPEFRAALEATGRRSVLVAGIETHVCVLQTALDLVREGYHVSVPADAVASRRALDWEIGLKLIGHNGAQVGTVETFLFQMMERAGTDEFRAISRRLK